MMQPNMPWQLLLNPPWPPPLSITPWPPPSPWRQTRPASWSQPSQTPWTSFQASSHWHHRVSLHQLTLSRSQPSEAYLTPTTPSSWLTSIQRNNLTKSINGNRGQRGRGIKLVAWNKGSALLHNKHEEVEAILAGHEPHILGLSEANLRSSADLSQVQHDEYQLHTAPTMSNPALGISRVVVYTHSSLVVKRRPDLEDETLSAIWLEVGMPRKRKILVANIYREWKFMNQGGSSESGTVDAQLGRWCLFLTKWEKAISEGQIFLKVIKL